MFRAVCLLLLLSVAGCGDPASETPDSAEAPAESPTDASRVVEATSLLGEPLYRPDVTGETLATYRANLDAALAARDANPDDPDAWVWVGRRLAYLGRYGDAIETFTDGAERWPDDPRFLRHRGHRLITTRQLEEAEADLSAAWALIEASGARDEIEPDGLPNARGTPVSTLHSNVRYHLGLARWLRGDFTGAAEGWGADVEAAVNPDMLVASSYWLWLSLKRLGQDDEAAAVLAPIDADLDIIENTAYHRLLMLFSGELTEADLIGSGEDALQNTTTAFGVAAWHLVNGRADRARGMFEAIVGGGGPWAAFGYIAAEAELSR
jgi:tetratricopeptide (TPR) repeat protein